MKYMIIFLALIVCYSKVSIWYIKTNYKYFKSKRMEFPLYEEMILEEKQKESHNVDSSPPANSHMERFAATGCLGSTIAVIASGILASHNIQSQKNRAMAQAKYSYEMRRVADRRIYDSQ